MKKLTFFLVLMFVTSVVFADVPTIHNPNAKVTITKEQILGWGQHNQDNPPGVIVLNFEGLGDLDGISQFYNGGTSTLGNTGTNYGVYFSSNTLSVIEIADGGSGNFDNEPSKHTCMFFLEGNSAIMNVTAGFTTGFSFYYSSNDQITVDVYDGLDGTGTLIATQSFPANRQNGCNSTNYCHWDPVGVAFSGTAMSVSFAGVQNFCGFDDVTFGSTTPGNQCSIPTLSEWGLIILGLLLLAVGMVYIRKRQYSFATAGAEDITGERKSLFNRRSYFIIFSILLGIAVVVFTIEIFLSVTVPVQDILGSIVSAGILAYILQLLEPSRKK